MFDKFPIPLLVIISLIGGAGSAALQNYYSKKITSRKDGLYFYSAALSFFAMIFIALFNKFQFKASAVTVILGCIFGLFILINNVTVSNAVAIGPLGYTTIIVDFSTIITAFSGLLIWHESVSVYKYIGLLFIVVSMYLSVNTQADQKKKSLKWLLLAVAGMISCALVGLTQKVFQSYEINEQLPTFLVISFLFSTVSSLILSFFAGRNEEKRLFKVIFCSKADNIRLLSLLCGAGLYTSLIHIINLKLVGALPTIMAFPLINGGTLLLTLLSSFVLFREKLTKKQTIGILSGIIAFAFLCF